MKHRFLLPLVAVILVASSTETPACLPVPGPTKEKLEKLREETLDQAIFIGVVTVTGVDIERQPSATTNEENVAQALYGNKKFNLLPLATYKGSINESQQIYGNAPCSDGPTLELGGIYRVVVMKEKGGRYYASEGFLEETNWRKLAEPEPLDKRIFRSPNPKAFKAQEQCESSGGIITFLNSRAACSFYVKE